VSIERFEYQGDPGEPELAGWENWGSAEEPVADGPAATSVADSGSRANESQLRAEFDQRLNEEKRKAFEAGREQGRQEGRTAERETQGGAKAAAEKQRVQQAAELVQNFAEERNRFLHSVEHEVVELALAVAARILRREAQMDPLLLTGAVRVALGQLSASTQVRLRVPEAEIDLWTEAIALIPKLAVKPVVLAGDGMLLGDCVVETELGSVDLGIRSQLGEIERGFFDRAHGVSRSASPELAGVGVGAEKASRV
jgi:flagellar assembly protein FliH